MTDTIGIDDYIAGFASEEDIDIKVLRNLLRAGKVIMNRPRVVKPNSKLKYGVGINDLPYVVAMIVNGKHIECPGFGSWAGRLKRCHSDNYVNHPSNVCDKDTTMCSEWLRATTYVEWFWKQDWVGNSVDKDLWPQYLEEVMGVSLPKKHYSPASCILVSPHVNGILNMNKGKGSDTLTGTTRTPSKKFEASCRELGGVIVHLGTFLTEEEAHLAWATHKVNYIKTKVNPIQKDERIPLVLNKWCETTLVNANKLVAGLST